MTEPAPAMSARMSAIEERGRTVLMPTYGRQPVALREGRGCRVTDVDGREYLDMIGGLAVSVLGHAHPAVLAAIQKQASRLVHVSNLVHSEPQLDAAEKLVATAFPSRVFFCNSGAEAVEGAIKLARKWGVLHGRAAGTIICARGAFHGRTMGALAATSHRRYRAPFEPLPRGFVHVAYDDLSAVAGAVDGSTVAVLMEPIEGKSGVVPMSDDTLRGLRRLCDEKDLLLILDEVQTGMGRTGRWWAHRARRHRPRRHDRGQGAGRRPPHRRRPRRAKGGRPGPWRPRLHLRRRPPDDVGGRGGHRRHRPRRARRELGACR